MKNVLILGTDRKLGRIVQENLKKHKDYEPVIIQDNSKQPYANNNRELRNLDTNLLNGYNRIDQVICLNHLGSETEKDYLKMNEKNVLKSIDFAKHAPVKKYVMLSKMGASDPDPNSPNYSQLFAQHTVDEYLIKSGIPYAIIRPEEFNFEEESWNIKEEMVLDEMGKINSQQVAQTLVAALDRNFGTGLSFEFQLF